MITIYVSSKKNSIFRI